MCMDEVDKEKSCSISIEIYFEHLPCFSDYTISKDPIEKDPNRIYHIVESEKRRVYSSFFCL